MSPPKVTLNRTVYVLQDRTDYKLSTVKIIFLDKKFKILINNYFFIHLKNYPIVLLMAQQDIEIS